MGSKKSDIEGLQYGILQEYLETGEASLIKDPEMVTYLEQLELVRGWHYSLNTEAKIIKALMLQYSDLKPNEAKSRYTDAINYYYCDTTIKKEAQRNMAASDLYNLYIATTRSAKEPKDYKIAADIRFKALQASGAMEDDPEQLPNHIYENPTQVFVMDPTLLGLPKANRNVLGKQIDALSITELKKARLKQHASIDAIELFPEDNE